MRLLTMDIESCTGGNRDGSLCSFGYVLSEDFDIAKQEDIIVNPAPRRFQLGRYGEEPRVKLAYSESTFRSAPKFPHFYDYIGDLISTATFVLGYAIVNDVKYLANACEVYGLKPYSYKFIDVQLIYRLYQGKSEDCGLATCATEFGIEYVEHRSDEDARVTLKVLECICKKLDITIEECLSRYGIYPGEVSNTAYRGCRAESIENERYSKSRRKNKDILISNFISNLKRNKNTTRKISIDKGILYGDVDDTRRLIYALAQAGYAITKTTNYADVYLVQDDRVDEVREHLPITNAFGKPLAIRPISIVAKEIALSSIGDIDFSQDDSILRKYYLEREREVIFGKGEDR